MLRINDLLHVREALTVEGSQPIRINWTLNHPSVESIDMYHSVSYSDVLVFALVSRVCRFLRL